MPFTRLKLVLAALAAVPACAPHCPQCPPPVVSPAPVSAAPPVAPTAEREKLAVLPIDDDELFRLERGALQRELSARVAELLPAYEVLPVAEVNAALIGKSQSGARCAFQGVAPERRVRDRGWTSAALIEIGGLEGKPPELWLELGNGPNVRHELAAEWKRALPRMERYRAAFAAFHSLPANAGVLGGLAASGDSKGAVKQGAITLCEEKSFFECSETTAEWKDAAPELEKCFAGVDQERDKLLLEGSRCEVVNLNDTSGARGKTEACVCGVLGRSKAASRAGRRKLTVSYLSPDIAGKPQPALRVIDVTGGLDSQKDWVSQKYDEGGKTRYRSWQRLGVDNLDAAAPALARCSFEPGAVVTAELAVTGAGTVARTIVTSGAKTKAQATCVENAFGQAELDCPSGDSGATLRVLLRYPR
ncbi:MAG: hypothetical protein KC776_16875 [Myxococcales bacterium]|nr:hypothetical protein [Myxococcales bacterium]MCB9575515.1 hypothetical protein [Polyangiaceae bacterium]